MKWLDRLLDKAPFPCICNARTPDYGKTYSGKFFVECSRCTRQVISPNKEEAIFAWDSKMMRELGQR